MPHEEVVFHLSHLIDSPTSEPLYSITIHDLLTAIAHRMGESALSLTAEDLQLAREECSLTILARRLF